MASTILLNFLLVSCSLVLAASVEAVCPRHISLQCPARCTCDSTGIIDCSGLEFTSLPTFLFPQTGVYRLVLDNNLITDLTSADFDKLQDLRELSITNNLLTSLDCQIFDKAPVTHLILDNNLLEDITDVENIGYLSKTLEELSLNGNKLNTANLIPFTQDSVEMLTKLSLAGNAIVGINYKSTTKLPKLVQLNLSNNRISLVHANMDYIAPNLQEIYLNDNFIKTIAENVFKESLHLTTVDLRNNEPLTCSFLPYVPENVENLQFDYCTNDDDSVYYPPGVPTPQPTDPPHLCSSKPGYFPRLADTFLHADLNKLFSDIPSESQCRQECDYYGEGEPCAAYTFLPQEGPVGLCYLWKASGAITESLSPGYTSVMRGLFTRYWQREVSSYDTILSITNHDRGSFEICERQCLLNSQCTGYDWHAEGGCYTYTGEIRLNSRTNDWSTGIRYMP